MEGQKRYKEMQIVEAENESIAHEKINAHYKSQESEYYLAFDIGVEYLNPCIVYPTNEQLPRWGLIIENYVKKLTND